MGFPIAGKNYMKRTYTTAGQILILSCKLQYVMSVELHPLTEGLNLVLLFSDDVSL